jgi:Protein of unknown function (DUF2785)
MTAEDLKEKLQTIAEQDHQATRTDIQHLLPDMLCFIGVPDSKLRELIYSTLAVWITRGLFTSSELQTLLQQALDSEHLFYKLGEENTDSVFTRAFSVLLIPPILSRHCKESFLSSETLQSTLQKITDYLHLEKDLRGYVRGKGWAHAVAHTADALDEFVQCHEIGRADLIGILNFIAEVASTEKSVYTCGEDERLVFAVSNAFKREELTKTDKVAWLESFKLQVQQAGPMPDPEGYQKFINIKHFLRTLYFSILQSDVTDKEMLLGKLQTLLKQFAEL